MTKLYGFHGSDGYDGFIQSKIIQNYPKILNEHFLPLSQGLVTSDFQQTTILIKVGN